MSLKMVPTGKRVIVLLPKPEEKTSGGIYLPDSAKPKQREGEVVALGSKVENKELKGASVLVPSYGGTTLTEYSKDVPEHILIHEDEILVILRG